MKIHRQRWMQPELPSWDHLAALVASEPSDLKRDAFQVLLRTGLRRGELLALAWPFVHVAEGLAEVRATDTWKPKSKKARMVPLDAECRAILARRQSGLTTPGPFRAWVGNAIEPSSLSHAFKDLVRAAGLPELRMHDLRHAFCTHLLNDLGVDARAVQEIAGHSSLQVTQVYLRARKETAQHVRDVLDRAQATTAA